jgi:hypothetical protein
MRKTKIIAALLLSCSATLVYSQMDPIITQSTNTSTSTSVSTSEATVKSPPPSAISPSITVINSDVCVTAVSGAAQTQILGISFGGTVRDMNCERLKLSRSLYDMGMKVAAVSAMCQDRRVWDAMNAAGTPCPIDGKIGAEAKTAWDEHQDRIPRPVKD